MGLRTSGIIYTYIGYEDIVAIRGATDNTDGEKH